MFEVYQDHARHWRWRLKSTNGAIVADSGEGYATEWGCNQAVATVKALAPFAGTRRV